jgi:hypothetical protein
MVAAWLLRAGAITLRSQPLSKSFAQRLPLILRLLCFAPVASMAQLRVLCQPVSAEAPRSVGGRLRTSPRPETAQQKSTAQAHTVPLRIRVTMRSFYFFTFALAAAVSGWGAVLCADQARDMLSSGSVTRAAERYAVPLVGMAALSAACLGCAAGAATDRRS